MAQEKKWKRCKCGDMIELTQGCNHMRCRCGREFCYLCGEPWRTCDCPQSGPRLDNLIERRNFFEDYNP
ncbi:hypothetical protein V8E51_008238 [Hyaloscypha variabilis]